jgi:hypothetical protein
LTHYLQCQREEAEIQNTAFLSHYQAEIGKEIELEGNYF